MGRSFSLAPGRREESAVRGSAAARAPLTGSAETSWAAGPAVLRARHPAKLSLGSPGRRIHGRAGGPRRASPGPPLLPASLRPAACAGRPERRRRERRWQGPSRRCLFCLPRQWRPKVSLCPRDRVPWLVLPLAHAAGPGRERAVAVAAASPRPAVALSAERARGVLRFAFSSFPLPVLFFPRGKKAAQSPYVRAR